MPYRRGISIKNLLFSLNFSWEAPGFSSDISRTGTLCRLIERLILFKT